MIDKQQHQILDAMDIQVWESRCPEVSADVVPSPIDKAEVKVEATALPPTAKLDWPGLQQTVTGCQACELHSTRRQTVFGVGDQGADWLFVGEAPGAEEDRKGEPFVGRAGHLLNAMLFALNLKREQVYIANVLKCLRYNALIQLGDGSWERIGRLVRKRYAGEVISLDSNGYLVPRRVTGWHVSPLGNRKVYRLSYRTAKRAGNSSIGIQLTGDHPVLTRRGYVPVQELTQHDFIATGQGLSGLAFDVVCGTLLGDGCITVNRSHLTFSHSASQQEYAQFKTDLLAELGAQIDSLNVAAVSGGRKAYPIVQTRTTAHRALRMIRESFYAKSKRVPRWLPDKFNERMLAIWFMDDGYTRIKGGRQPLAEIATCGFDQQDLGILINSLYRLDLQASTRRGRLYFDVEQTKRLSKLIAPYVPISMRYKLHPSIANDVPFNSKLLSGGPRKVFYDQVLVEDITSESRTDRSFYCIDVEETHNFVTSAGVVHNCRPPANRDPAGEEVQQCEPYLLRQVELIQPRVIVALGRFAAQSLLKTSDPISRLRGRTHHYGNTGIPLVVTYHPAYLLRSPIDKKKAWADLCLARSLLEASS